MKTVSRLVFGGLLAAPLAFSGCSGGSSSGASSVAPASFRSLATFDVKTIGGEVAEIAAISPDGNTLVYTDSESEEIGFLDITNLSAIQNEGQLAMGGEPTSVAFTRDGAFAIAVVAGLNQARVVRISDGQIVRSIALPGQPDSVAVSPDGRFAAIAIENERADEDTPLPQSPAGSMVVLNLTGAVTSWTSRVVALNLPSTLRFPTDAEPEYVDINARNEAAVTLQENNGVAIVPLGGGGVRYFSAGTTTHKADLKEDGTVAFTDTLSNSRREPDGIAWTPRGNLITANEGDYDLDLNDDQFVGGRNFTVFSSNGSVLFDENERLETETQKANRYDDRRSDSKGVEPENVRVATIGGRPFAFFALERADSLAVYRLDSDARPTFVQILPTGDAPEGIAFNARRNLIVSANEGDGTLSFFGV